MKKWLAFGCPLLIAVAGAAGLRYWQRVSAFEETGLLTPGAPATWCLVGLVLLSAVGFFLLARLLLGPAKARRLREDGPRGYLAAFSLPHRALMVVYLLAGGLLLAAGLIGIRNHQAAAQLMKTTGMTAKELAAVNVELAGYYRLSYYVFSIALVPTGLDLALVGWLNAQRQEAQGRFAWPLLLPGWCGCIWLIAAYQAQTAQPGVMTYAFYFLGALSAVGACYMMASFSFERPRPVWTAWLCAMGLTLLGTAAVDGYLLGNTYRLLVCLGFMIYLAAQLKCLLYRSQVPADLEPWQSVNDDETEVSEDE